MIHASFFRGATFRGATLAALLFASPVLAAPDAGPAPVPAPAAAPATQDWGASLGGPAIAGVCLLNPSAVMADSAVGKSANARLQQLHDKVQSGLEAEKAAIDAEARRLQAQQATVAPALLEHRQQQIQARFQALQTKAAIGQREMELTGAKARVAIMEQARPVISAVYKAKGCGLLFNAEAAIGGNLGNDLTRDVITGLDAKITSLNFDLERVSAPGGR